MPVASFSFLALPAWVTAIVLLRIISTKAALILSLVPICILLMLDMSVGYWHGQTLFTNNNVRLALSLAPSLISGAYISPTPTPGLPLRTTAITIFLGSLISALLPATPITQMVFDEGHGKWETVIASFGPDDFGRAANYTYSLLFEKAKKLVGHGDTLPAEDSALPTTDSLLVIKMPAEPLTEGFSQRVREWVANGGRLLVVADHTDLYDTTQHTNSLLAAHFGVRINSDSVFNHSGMPTVPTVAVAGGLVGRIDAHGLPMPWQTGASLGRIPLNSIELMTYGPSFSEEGDYSSANRFGPFVPQLTKRYFNHSAAIALAHGEGAVAVLLDSTPWSNFSIFREQYSRMLRGIVHSLEHPSHLRAISGAAIILFTLCCVAAIWPNGLLALCISLCLGIAFGSGLAIGSISWEKPKEDRDYLLRVVTGPPAKIELLKQLLLPGERNYSRIISAMGKYSLMPMASPAGAGIPDLRESRSWLFIEPSDRQLPKYQDLINHLRNGRNITILFSPEQATDPAVLAWLKEWGLLTRRNNGLSLFDGAQNSLVGGRAAILGRELRVVTAARGTSILNPYAADPFVQTYTLRPTTFPRTSGFLSIGFAADQFSDDAVGEVWEGIYPSTVGRIREKHLATVILGEERPPMLPASFMASERRLINLPAFLVLENGEKRLQGRFSKGDDDNTTKYFKSLRDRAGGFIYQHCPPTSPNTLEQCSARLLNDDMMEWLVSWRTGPDGELIAIELLHERRLSGSDSTWNVLFGK